MISTKLSTISTEGQDLVGMTLHDRAILDAAGMAEALRACKELQTDGSIRIFIELPIEADFNMTFMKLDHFKEADMHACLAALVVYTENPFLERLMGLYFAYFPQPYPLRICRTRSEALAWLNEAHEELGRGVA